MLSEAKKRAKKSNWQKRHVSFRCSEDIFKPVLDRFCSRILINIILFSLALFLKLKFPISFLVDKLASCFICKADACPRTRPLKKGRGQQYGIPDDSIPAGARVCNSCQCKSVRNRYPNCPLPTCPNIKDRGKRLRNIPQRLFELNAELRDPIILEFQIPPAATRCCSACLMRIRRKLDPHIQLTDEEHRTDGDESDVSTSSCDEREPGGSDTASVESPQNPQRQTVASSSSSSTTALANSSDLSGKDFHSKLKSAVAAAAASGNGSIAVSTTTVSADTTSGAVSNSSSSKSDERLLPPLGHAPKKQKTSEEYDSSATETADEENENSPANRQSPKVIVNSNASNLAPPPATNGPPPPMPPASGAAGQNIMIGREPASINVQDFLHTVIERSLKQKAGPPPSKIAGGNQAPTTGKASANSISIEHATGGRRMELPLTTSNSHNANSSGGSNSNSNSSNNDVTIVREFRSDGSIVKQSTHSMGGASVQQRQSNANAMHVDSLATLSLVNSHMPPSHAGAAAHLQGHAAAMMHQQAVHDIKATITPVNSSKIGKTPTPPSHSHGGLPPGAPPDTIIYGVPSAAVRNNEPEPQTLDLSIKKPSRDGPSPSSSSSSSGGNSAAEQLSRHHASVAGQSVKHVGNAPSMYRQPEPHGAPTYLYHPHPGSVGVGKAPPPMGAMYVSPVPVPISITQPGGSVVGGRSQVIAVLGTQPPPNSQPPPPPHQQQAPPPIPQTHGVHMQQLLSQQQQQQQKLGGNVNKLPPKLSPQIIQHPQSASPSQQQQMKGGPKGSITHGTPVNNSGAQQIIQVHSSPATLSPSLMRQTPPSNSAVDNKLGSITQGTPIQLPSHHQLDNKRAYEYYKSATQRQSPAQQSAGGPPPPQQSSQQQPPPQGYAVSSPYGRSPYGVEPVPVLSTRQIVMHDYMTSQQMQGQQRNVSRGSSSSAGGAGSDKESASPRNNMSAVGGTGAGSNSGLLLYEYSRVSPADHVNR